MTPTALLESSLQGSQPLLTRLLAPAITGLCFLLSVGTLQVTDLLEWSLICWMAVVSVLFGQAAVLMLATYVEGRSLA